MQNSPYLVESSKNPQQAIKFAIEKGLFEKFNINKELVEDYLNSKGYIPIWILEAACNINKDYIEIPVQYQYLWFCLHNRRIRRIAPKGKVINPKNGSNVVYIDLNKKIEGLIKKSLNIYPKYKLAKLCGYKSGWPITLWLRKKERISIFALMKICQIQKKDIWNVIDNCKIYSKTNYNSIFYKNILHKRDLIYLLTWIKTEGHISITKQYFEIKQDENGKNILIEISKIAQRLFNIEKNKIHFYQQKQYKNIWALRINSAPLRQLLILKYKIDPGYKCQTVSLKNELELLEDREDINYFLAKLIEAEGSFTYHLYNNHKYPRIYISTTSPKICEEIKKLLKKIGYHPNICHDKRQSKKNIGYSIAIEQRREAIDLCYNIFPYISHKKKIKKFIKELQRKEFILNLRLNSNDKIITLIKKVKGDISNTELANMLSKKVPEIIINKGTISNWLQGSKPPLIIIFHLCNLMKEDTKNYIPSSLKFILWAQNLIKTKELDEIRGESFKNVRL